MAAKKKDTRIRPGFGDLNQIEKPNTAITYDPTDTTVMGAMRNILKDQYNNKVFDNVGTLKGIVLRVETSQDNSANSIWASLPGMTTKPLLQLKVRIPEIHSCLPEPALYGDVPNGPHQDIIDKYPTFTAIDEEASKEMPSVGDIVIVDFADRNNLTQPVYIKKFADGPGTAGDTSSNETGIYIPGQTTEGKSAFDVSNGLRGDASNTAPPTNAPLIRGCSPSSGGYLSATSQGGRLSPSSTVASKLERAQNTSYLIKEETGISISVPLLYAFMEVESLGRIPTKNTVRFEPHVFLGMRGPAITTGKKGSKPDLYGGPNYTGNNKVPYASQGNTSSQEEWAINPSNRKKFLKGRDFFIDKNSSHTNRDAFERAFNLDPVQAIKSTSWGSYQVMGWALLRVYDNDPIQALSAYDADPLTTSDLMIVQWFKDAFRSSRKRQAFTQTPPNFDEVVKTYNGTAQVRSYSPKLRKSYEKFINQSVGSTSSPTIFTPLAEDTICSDSTTSSTTSDGTCIKPTRPTPDSTGTWTQKGIIRGKEYDFTAQYIGKHIVDERVAEAFLKMQADAKKDGVDIKINSAFRTPEEQEFFYCKFLNGTGNKAAKPGFSNHQSGVALDLNTKGVPNDKSIRRRTGKSTGQGDVWEWLNKNGSKYGFRQIQIEHWHWQHEPTKRANLAQLRKGIS